jgi:UDP-N-acetylmuramoyl-tripeptide--D-alanyl-D-alanine ligase
MISADLNWIADVLDVTYSGENSDFTTIATDSRSLKAGEVFLALTGPNFDGHKFAQKAQELGAKALIVESEQAVNIPQFVVDNSRLALGKLGAAVMAHVKPKTVAVTGSVGKTTVKEMAAAILSQLGEVLATDGNFNNDIGVPLTLLRLAEKHQYAVIELGANHLGEIAYTTDLVKPDVAAITNVAEAHLEGFGDLFGVARAKGEIFLGLPQNGVAVVNADSEFIDYWLTRLADKTITQFSLQQHKDIWAENIQLDEFGRASFDLVYQGQSHSVKLPIPGEHNVTNSLVAAALVLPLGVTLAQAASGLCNMPQVKGRVNIIEATSQLTLIDDSYNANPGSVRAAIDLLSSIKGKKVLVLGDMAELGENARVYHQEVGEYAKEKGIYCVYTLGVLSQSASDVFELPGKHFSTREKLIEALKLTLKNESLNTEERITILIKGSRSSRMELLVDELIN